MHMYGTPWGDHCRAAPWLLAALLNAAMGAVMSAVMSPVAAADGMPAAARAGDGRTVTIAQPRVRVIDGDTFEAELPAESSSVPQRRRVRLLYVDTPEIHRSHKGLDLEFGLPARAALKHLLDSGPLRLELAAAPDRYGRALALVWAGEEEVNLRLIAEGHSYFDTRFGFPERYETYADAEGAAFDSRRGIWSERKSRSAYLKRLRRERKTPRGRRNRLFVAGTHHAESLQPGDYTGKYILVEGLLARVRSLRNGVVEVLLRADGPTAPVRAVAFPPTAAQLRLLDWTPGGRVTLEGFVQTYRGAPELQIHFGRRHVPGSAAARGGTR